MKQLIINGVDLSKFVDSINISVKGELKETDPIAGYRNHKVVSNNYKVDIEFCNYPPGSEIDQAMKKAKGVSNG